MPKLIDLIFLRSVSVIQLRGIRYKYSSAISLCPGKCFCPVLTQVFGFFQELMSGLFTETEQHLQTRRGKRVSPAAMFNVAFVWFHCQRQEDPARQSYLVPEKTSS